MWRPDSDMSKSVFMPNGLMWHTPEAYQPSRGHRRSEGGSKDYWFCLFVMQIGIWYPVPTVKVAGSPAMIVPSSKSACAVVGAVAPLLG